MHYCRCGFYWDCGTLARCFTRNTRPLYHSVPEASSPDPGTARSLHLYPVYVDSCMHYEVVVAACLREVLRFFVFFFASGITAPVCSREREGKNRKESLPSVFGGGCVYLRVSLAPSRKKVSQWQSEEVAHPRVYRFNIYRVTAVCARVFCFYVCE